MPEPIQHTLVKQFILFAGIGVIGTATHYLLLVCLVQLLKLHPVLATSCGFAAGALVNYILNYHYTFRSQLAHRTALTKFLIIALIGAGFNAAIMQFGISTLKLHYFIAQLAATAIVLLWNFAANKLWTFSGKVP